MVYGCLNSCGPLLLFFGDSLHLFSLFLCLSGDLCLSANRYLCVGSRIFHNLVSYLDQLVLVDLRVRLSTVGLLTNLVSNLSYRIVYDLTLRLLLRVDFLSAMDLLNGFNLLGTLLACNDLHLVLHRLQLMQAFTSTHDHLCF